MIKHLYGSFAERWDHGGNVWFYSDPHFADDEMKYIRKNYIGDEEQVRRINSKITDRDTLVILGDIGDKRWVKKLRGYKVLVRGNHDGGDGNYIKRSYFINVYNTKAEADQALRDKLITGYIPLNHNEDYFGYYNKGCFDEVYGGCLMISPKIILSHEPVDFPYALNIHGHTHDLLYHHSDTHLNVCAEAIDYTPVCLKHIAESGILKNIPDIHRETIDNAANKK